MSLYNVTDEFSLTDFLWEKNKPRIVEFIKSHSKGLSSIDIKNIVRGIEINYKHRGIPCARQLSLIYIESGFGPHRISEKGAIGLCQIMPGTGRAMLGEVYSKQYLKQPLINVITCGKYLDYINSNKDKTQLRILAEYNAGNEYKFGLPYAWRVLDYEKYIIKKYKIMI